MKMHSERITIKERSLHLEDSPRFAAGSFNTSPKPKLSDRMVKEVQLVEILAYKPILVKKLFILQRRFIQELNGDLIPLPFIFQILHLT
jgi:hypothetical protein